MKKTLYFAYYNIIFWIRSIDCLVEILDIIVLLNYLNVPISAAVTINIILWEFEILSPRKWPLECKKRECMNISCVKGIIIKM